MHTQVACYIMVVKAWAQMFIRGTKNVVIRSSQREPPLIYKPLRQKNFFIEKGKHITSLCLSRAIRISVCILRIVVEDSIYMGEMVCDLGIDSHLLTENFNSLY